MNILFRASLLISAAGWVATAANAADWPQYRGTGADGSTTETIAKAWPASGPKALWKVPLSDGFSSFTTGGGKAFTLVTRTVDGVKRETVLALDAATGKELWAFPIAVSKYDGGGDSGTDDNKGGDGPRSTPSFHQGKVYVLSAGLKLLALDAKTGKQIWVKNIIEDHAGKNIQWQNAASPLVDGNLVFAAGGGAGQALLGVNAMTGEVVWKSQDDVMTHATPIVATIHGQRQVIFFTQKGLVSVKANDGQLLWRYPFKYAVSTAASPVVSGDIVYCSAGYGVGSGAVRVAKTGETWAASELWRTPGNDICNHWSTPVALDGYLYGMFSFKKYGTGPLKCVEIATGKELWAEPGFGPGNVILVGGQMLALGDAGQLVLVKPSPKAYQEVARAKVLSGKCWSTPIVSGGHVFARSTKEGVALNLSSSVSLK